MKNDFVFGVFEDRGKLETAVNQVGAQVAYAGITQKSDHKDWDQLIVGFQSRQPGLIGDMLQRYGAVEVHIGDEEEFRAADGQLLPALAGIIQTMRFGGQQPQWPVSLAGDRWLIDLESLRPRTLLGGGEERSLDDPWVPTRSTGSTFRLSDYLPEEPQITVRDEPAPAPPGPPDNTPPKSADRFMEGRFPRMLRLGERCFLEVRIAVQVSGDSSASKIRNGVLPEGKPADVLLLLHAPGFQIFNGSRDRKLTVPVSGNSDFAVWELQANQSGVLDLAVTAYYGSAPLGELTLQITADPAVETGPSEEHSADAQIRKGYPGEVTLEIRYDQQSKTYRVRFISDDYAGDDIDSKPLLRTPEVAINELITQLNAIAQGKSKMDPGTTRKFLRGQGVGLWKEFIPDDLQRLFWNRRSEIHRIRVRSAGDLVPWELLYPAEPGKAPDPQTGFLGEAFKLSRWRFGEVAGDRLSYGQVCCVLPENSPPQAAAEVKKVQEIMGGNSAVATTLNELLAMLESKAFGILHFACHNRFRLDGPVTGSVVSMPDGPFQPSLLNNYLSTLDQPLIFMNACRTDANAPSYTRLTGWAGSFLDTGAGAFIGSLWEVRDGSAAKFATTFYETLRAKTLGEAMAAARDSIMGVEGDPTWLAYSFYGDPEARREPGK